MKEQKHTPGPWQVHGSHIYTADPERALLAQVLNPGNKASDYPLPANARLIAAAPDMLAELIYRCAECNGWGAFRCQWYNKDGDMCRMAHNGTCETWMTICRATGHDPATPWEVEK